jgi:type I restriction enzyme S subunit
MQLYGAVIKQFERKSKSCYRAKLYNYKLRFVGMMQMRLENVCTVFTDGDWIESKDQSESGIRLIQTGNIGEGQYLEKETHAKYISKETFDKLKCTEIFPGDILVSRLPEPVGRACIIPQKNERMITAVDCTICRPNEEIVNKEYLCYFMRSSTYYNRLLGNVTGTTRKRISRKNLGNVELDVPSLSEQSAVVEKLNCVVNIIFARKQELQKFDDLIKARFVEMFGDPVLNNKGWDIKKLDEVCDGIGDGLHGTPEYSIDGEYPFINGNNLMDGVIEITPATKMVDANTYKKYYIAISPNAMLISINGTLGKLAFYNGEEVMLGKSACYCNLKPEINREFVYGVMKTDSFARFLEEKSTQSTTGFARTVCNVLRTCRQIKSCSTEGSG